VPVEKVITEYVNTTDTLVERDSIWCYDSIYVEKDGDTVTIYKTKILYKDKWRDRVLRDSVIKVDSIQVPYPVEKQLTKWEKTKMSVGGISIGFCLLLIILILAILFLRVRKKS
jgi:hypothetical protein